MLVKKASETCLRYACFLHTKLSRIRQHLINMVYHIPTLKLLMVLALVQPKFSTKSNQFRPSRFLVLQSILLRNKLGEPVSLQISFNLK